MTFTFDLDKLNQHSNYTVYAPQVISFERYFPDACVETHTHTHTHTHNRVLYLDY